jgi:hypothetical protein
MGFNFINSQAKHHTKAWNDRFTTAANNLFALPMNPVERTFVAKNDSGGCVAEGATVHVRRVESRLAVYKGLSPLAVADKPSLALYEMVDSGHGVLQGVISQVIPEANLLLIKVVEGRSK